MCFCSIFKVKHCIILCLVALFFRTSTLAGSVGIEMTRIYYPPACNVQRTTLHHYWVRFYYNGAEQPLVCEMKVVVYLVAKQIICNPCGKKTESKNLPHFSGWVWKPSLVIIVFTIFISHVNDSLTSEITDKVSFGQRDHHLHLCLQMKQVW